MAIKKSLTPEQEHWLVNVGWKRKTITQLQNELEVSQTLILNTLKRHDKEPVTKREIVASEILSKYGTEIPAKNVHEAAMEFNISDVLMKGIILEYGLTLVDKHSQPMHRVMKAITAPHIDEEIILEKIKQREDRVNAIKKGRSAFTYYTQTGTDLTDSLRGIKTTKRV